MRGQKTRCSGQWTEARFKGFIVSLLRAGTMRWRPRHDAIKNAFVRNGINPDTGRKCKLHRCAVCQGEFPQTYMHADHIEPVVELTGFKDWNTYINRLFVEADKMRALCHTCHKVHSAEQNEERREAKRSK